MARCHLPLLLLMFAWSHARHGGSCAELHAHRRRHGGGTDVGEHVPDALTEHMQRLYHKYTQPGHAFKDGNTVRSFKATWGFLGSQRLQIFNLTSLRSSESVLSATLHFAPADPPPRSSPDRSPAQLLVWSYGSPSGHALGHVRFPLPHARARGGAWQWRDVTRLVNAAAGRGEELLIGVRPASGAKRHPPPELTHPPYILLYANDSAIAEPESVVSTLQRPHLPALETAVQQQLHGQLHNGTKTSAPPRQRRSVNLLSPLQNNELPEREYPGQKYPEEYPGQQYPGQQYPGQQYPYDPSWDEASPYRPVDKNTADSPKDSATQRRAKKKSRKEGKQKVALLQFDERTMKKARRKWAEPRGCSRRYLKVDFADIGWSDWIISPKAYDAFYCAGSCQFPMNKALKPSNHATIQSIVRAVGVVPGVPEPCCVPEKMSSLSILFFDEQANVVLKVYPNMSVESCACR